MNRYILVSLIWISFLTNSLGNIRVELRIRGDSDNEMDMKAARQSDMSRKFVLYGRIRKEMALMTLLDQFNSNVICSPMAILLSLAQFAHGSEEATLNELENAIGVKRKEIPNESSNLLDLVNIIGSHTMVTRLFIARTLNLRPKFKEDVLKTMPSQIRAINFIEKASAARLINNWVKKQTKNNIRSVISKSDINKNTELILISTLVLKCEWQNKFHPTTADTFHSSSGDNRIAMMSQRETLRYHGDGSLDAKLIEIPLRNNAGQFLIVLPNNRNGLRNLLNAIKTNPSQLNDAYTRMSMTGIELKMPKFKIETELNLEPLLKLLGVKNIFPPGDGLTRMIETKTVHLSGAFQKCVIDISEGTAIGGAVTNSSALLKRSETKKINVNHPFLFYIVVRGEQVVAGIYNGPISTLRNQDVSDDDYNQ